MSEAPDEPDEMALLDILTGYQPAAAVTAACRLGVFDHLGDSPASPDALAAALGVDAGALAPLLDSLARLGLVAHDTTATTADTGAGHTTADTDDTTADTGAGHTTADTGAAATGTGATAGGYRHAGALGRRLASDGDLARIVAKEAVFARAWLDLDVTVRTAVPRLAAWSDRLVHEPDVARSFLEALVVLADLVGPDLTTLPELIRPPVSTTRPVRVLDVGGGLGAHSRPLAAAGAAVTLVDLPVVAGWAAEALAEPAEPAEGPGITIVGADVVVDGSCGVPAGSHDAALVSHLLHDLPDDEAVRCLRHACAAVRPGGHVVVVEIPGDAGPGAVGPLFDLMMRVETRGLARPLARLVSCMGEAGIQRVRRVPGPEPVAVLVGTRP